jgi:OFA family oxalate/formate antiporter-like MFS transporter
MSESSAKRVNRVPVFFAAMFTVGMGGYLFTWSYFRDGLRGLYPEWTESQLSLPFSVHNITVIFMLFVAGFLLRKLSNRTVVLAGIVALFVGLGLFAFLPEDNPQTALVLIVVCFGIIAALSVGIGAVVSFDTYQPWFPERVGLTSGIWTMWGGGSPIVLGALCGVYTQHFGVLKGIALLGVTLTAILLLTLFFAKKPGEDVRLPQPKSHPNAHFSDLRPGEMLRTSGFWHLFLFNLFARAAGLIVTDLGGTIAADLGVATLAGLLFAPANGISSVIGGYLMDRIRLSRVILLYVLVLFAGGLVLVLGNAAASAPLILTGMVLVGLSYGGTNVGSVAAVRIMFGDTHYAQNLSFIVASAGPASLSVFFTGWLIQRAGGSYTPAFVLILVLSIAAVIDCIIMIKTRSFERVAAAKTQR